VSDRRLWIQTHEGDLVTIGSEEIQKMLDDERAKLAPEKIASFEATEAMKAMLAVPEKTDDSVYEFGTLKIKHHRFLTKRLRLVMGQLQTKIKNAPDPIAEQDSLIYQMLSEMSTEPPWTDPEAWRYVDLKFDDGRIYTIFFSLVMKMGGDEETLKDFRRKH
jgi:hypothetical protein